MSYPQSPYPQQYQPQPDYVRQAAATRSYTTPAVITLVLYFVLWLPGLIANIVYLSAANSDKNVSGIAPQGRGCLVALLIVFIGLPFFACVGFFALSVLGAGMSAAVATPMFR